MANRQAGLARTADGVRLVALFEAAKGAVVLLAGFGVLAALHDGAARIVDELARHAHLNPARGVPRIFAAYASDLDNPQLRLLAAGAFAYVAVRAVEAYGLWNRRRWAEWFSAIGGLVYVPFELYELAHGVTALKLLTLAINLVVVGVIVLALRRGTAHASSTAR